MTTDEHLPSGDATLPPAINLKMALDFLAVRATELGLVETAHFIGTASLMIEDEARRIGILPDELDDG